VINIWSLRAVSAHGTYKDRLLVLTNEAVYRVIYSIKQQRVCGFDRVPLPAISVVRCGALQQVAKDGVAAPPAHRWTWWLRRRRSESTPASVDQAKAAQNPPAPDASGGSAADEPQDDLVKEFTMVEDTDTRDLPEAETPTDPRLFSVRLGCTGHSPRTFICRGPEDEPEESIRSTITEIAQVLVHARNSHDGTHENITAELHKTLGPVKKRPAHHHTASKDQQSHASGGNVSDSASTGSSSAKTDTDTETPGGKGGNSTDFVDELHAMFSHISRCAESDILPVVALLLLLLFCLFWWVGGSDSRYFSSFPCMYVCAFVAPCYFTQGGDSTLHRRDAAAGVGRSGIHGYPC
jgi:Inositol phosphatase